MSFIFFDGFDSYQLPEDSEAFSEKFGFNPANDDLEDPETQALIAEHIQKILYGPNSLNEETEAYLQEYDGGLEADDDTVELHLRMSGNVLERNRDVIDAISDASVPELEEEDDFALMVGATFSQCDSVVDKLEGAVALLGDADIAILNHSIPDGLADKLDRMSAAIRTLQRRLGASWYHRFVDGRESE